MREMVEELAGGMRDGYGLRAVLPGGASTHFIPAHEIDIPMDFDHMKQAGNGLGTGTALLLDDSVCPVGMVRNLLRFFAQESCGWCTPCWGGLPWAADVLNDIEEGRGRPATSICSPSSAGSWARRCASATSPRAPPSRSAAALKLFRDDFERHIAEGRCSYRHGAPAAGASPAGARPSAAGPQAGGRPAPAPPAPRRPGGLPGLAPERAH